jgi:hypothetical protein
MPSNFIRIGCLLGLSMACAAVGSAQTGAPATPRTSDAFLGTATYRLWDGDAPGAQGSEDLDVPTLTVFRVQPNRATAPPSSSRPAGPAAPRSNLEGQQVADWFAARRRRSSSNTVSAAAICIRRRSSTRAERCGSCAHAAEFDVAPDRIGMMGFSAGGHLTAMAATQPGPAAPTPPTPWIGSEAGPTSRCSAIRG